VTLPEIEIARRLCGHPLWTWGTCTGVNVDGTRARAITVECWPDLNDPRNIPGLIARIVHAWRMAYREKTTTVRLDNVTADGHDRLRVTVRAAHETLTRSYPGTGGVAHARALLDAWAHLPSATTPAPGNAA
jgi:hypothetical protein